MDILFELKVWLFYKPKMLLVHSEPRYAFDMWVARTCLRVIRLFNRYKDESLANMLHDAAHNYQRDPNDGWQPPTEH